MLEETQEREEIIEPVAALDVGKAELVCCARVPGRTAARRAQEVASYSTMTRSLLAMSDRLRELGVTRVVMEATSDYWKPPFYLLEAQGFEVWLVNAKDVKHLPGRPENRQAGRGVAVQGRRAPDAPPELRAPERDPPAPRPDPLPDRSGRGVHRPEAAGGELLEDAQIKLAVVASDIFGVSGRKMMAALVGGERDPKVLAQMARGRLRAKLEIHEEAFTGYVTDHHAFLLAKMLARVDQITADVAELDAKIEGKPTPTPPLDQPMRRLSDLANHSKLWLLIAGGMFVLGEQAGWRAATAGLVAIALSANVNIPIKLAGRRTRPDREAAGVPASRRLEMPSSPSLPSGHTDRALRSRLLWPAPGPAIAAPLRLLPSIVGYSRVHTGVHYPGDVVLGPLIGTTIRESVALGARWIVQRA